MLRCNSRKRRALVVVAAAAALTVTSFAPENANAVIRDWIAGNGNFNLAGNWSGGVVPGGGDIAHFVSPSSYAVTFDANPVNLQLAVEVGSGAVTFRSDTVANRTYNVGAMSLFGGSLTMAAPTSGSNTLLIASPSLFMEASTLNVQANNDINFNGGAVTLFAGTNFNITGAGSSVVMSGAGPLNIGLTTGAAATVSVNSAGSFSTGTGQISINPTGVLSINNGTFNANGNIFIEGGRLERLSSSGFNLAGGKTLFANNNAQVVFTGNHTIGGGSTYTFQNGADFSATSYVDVGFGTNGTLVVDGLGSTFTAGGASYWGAGGGIASVTFRNQAQVNLSSGVFIGQDGVSASNGNVAVQSGATMTMINGDILIGTGNGATGVLTVGSTTANPSTVAIGGTSTLRVGSASGSATFNVNTGGVFNSGTGGVAVSQTGSIVVNGGTFNANGNVAITGGIINLSAVSATPTFNLAAGRAISLVAGGRFLSDVAITTNTSNSIAIADPGSLLWLAARTLAITRGSTLSASADGDVAVNALVIGDSDGDGTASFDGFGTRLDAYSAVTVGSSGGTGDLSFANSAAGIVGTLNIATGAVADTHGMMSLTNANVATSGAVAIGTSSGAGSAGALNVNSGGWLNQTNGTLTVGSFGAAGGTGTLNIIGGEYDAGGDIDVRTSGVINIDGGSLYTAGNITVNGGRIERTTALGAGLQWNSTGRQLSLFGGARVLLPEAYLRLLGGSATISDNSSLETPNGTLQVESGSTMNVVYGGDFSGSNLDIGIGSGSANTLVVDGWGSSITTTSASLWGGGSTANVTLRSNASATMQSLHVAGLADANSRGYVNIETGADLTVPEVMIVGNGRIAGGEGVINLTGAGSTLSIATTPGGYLWLGSDSASTGVINVNSGATMTVGITTYLNPTGTLNLNGGTASLGVVVASGGVINFNSGTLTLGNGVDIDAAGVLGPTLNLTSNHRLTLADLWIHPGRTLTLSGGTLTANQIINNGTLAFNSGTINVTGGAGLVIGSGQALGATLELGAAQNFNVTNASAVLASGTLAVNSGGRFTTTSTLSNFGEIRLGGGTARVTATSIANSKLILGDGRVDGFLNNSNGGEIRVMSGQRLHFAGTGASNVGKINLIGGTFEVDTALGNAAGGTISGRGTFIGRAGLLNYGNMQLSGGASDIFGSVTNNSGGKIIVSGNALATFYDPVTNNSGAEFRVSSGSTAVFFGNVANSGTFTGTGTKFFEAGSTGVLGALASSGRTIVSDGAAVSASYVREAELTVDGDMSFGVGGGTSRVGALSVGDAGTLDLANNKLIVANGDVATLTALIQSAQNAGAWDGPGITTTMADAAAGLTSLGIANADDAGYVGSTFGGVSVFSGDALIMYTYAGDANLDGFISGDDYSTIDFNVGTGATGWNNGDFNYDGIISGDDYSTIDFNYAAQGAPFSTSAAGDSGSLSAVTAVPEPGAAMACVFAVASAALTARRRR
ncbi:MAG: hypothetical protein QOF78_1057 [Phycisphaerales bacterium]|jgi:hypothetical protein|nr:hypothetical protein [Phycisphaerales bacterium]